MSLRMWSFFLPRNNRIQLDQSQHNIYIRQYLLKSNARISPTTKVNQVNALRVRAVKHRAITPQNQIKFQNNKLPKRVNRIDKQFWGAVRW